MLKFQAWQFDEILNNQNALVISPSHFWVTCLDYHCMQSDLVESGILKA